MINWLALMTYQPTVSNPESSTNLIIVMGVSGSGKSTLAKALGDIYGYEFLDADDFHSAESRALMAKAIPLTDEHRKPWVAAIKQRLQSNDAQNIHTVLAFSGLKKKHRDELRTAGLRTLVLYLDGSKETIGDRMVHRTNHYMPVALLDSQFASMEDPTSEPDVHLLDVRPPVHQVVQRACGLVDKYLNTSTKA